MFVLSWIKFFRGYVYVHLTGYATERFLNLCGSRNILIWNLKPTEDGYYFYISVDGYRSLKPILKNKDKGAHFKKYGVPFQLFRYRKHKVFAAGIAVSAVLLFYCSGFVWNIEVKGNSYLSEETILSRFCRTKMQASVCQKRNINCEELEEKLRSAYSEVIWTSVKVYGTKMTVELQGKSAAGGGIRGKG